VKRGLSQERLAFDAGVDRSYVSGLEKEEQNPTVDLLDRLSKTLSIHISELFTEAAPRSGSAEITPKRTPTGQVGHDARRFDLSTQTLIAIFASICLHQCALPAQLERGRHTVRQIVITGRHS
jgi:transcriptional regulator with XRE-family HTH domain